MPPSSADIFVKMIDDEWDMYTASKSGRTFYFNPASGEAKWKPPRRKLTSAARLPRSSNGVFSFGSDIDHMHQSDRSTIVRESQRFLLPFFFVICRPTIIMHIKRRRTAGCDLYIPPPGYTEYYNKETGHIHYVDNVNNVQWLTSQDPEGRLYFYNKSGESTWQLPRLDLERKSSVVSAGQPLLDVALQGYTARRVTGYMKEAGAGHPVASVAKKKWQNIYAVQSERYLLNFSDEEAFRRMGEDADSLPDLCVDLTQCRLSWQSTSILRLRSQLTGIDLQLQWEEPQQADLWYDSLTDNVKEVATASQPTTPRSPETAIVTDRNLLVHVGARYNPFKTLLLLNRAAPLRLPAPVSVSGLCQRPPLSTRSGSKSTSTYPVQRMLSKHPQKSLQDFFPRVRVTTHAYLK
jgi:hypothetical protein